MTGRTRKSPTPKIFIQSCLLVQLDLEGHSEWFDHVLNKLAAAQAKVDLAEQLKKELAAKKFKPVFWAGDGGMFYRPADGLKNFDCAVEATRAIADIFSKWKKQTEDRSVLRVRISAHKADGVLAHPDPSYWTSSDLNIFAKNEREIGIAGAIGI